MIAIHSHHQQRCENFVQMLALISKTKVKEARRTQRAIAISLVIRRFNQLSLDRLLGATNARGVGREQRGNLRGGCMSKLCVE